MTITRHGIGPIYMFEWDGDHEASLLLLDHLWDEQAGVVDGEIVANVCARDRCFFAGSNCIGGLDAMVSVARETVAKGPYSISDTLLVRRDGRWEKFEAPTMTTAPARSSSTATATPIARKPWWKFW
jgi:hypothetical protein